MGIMFRIAIIERFKRFYSHNIRNGFSSEVASDKAFSQTRDEILNVNSDLLPTVKDKEERIQIWEAAAPTLIEFRAVLINIPIDRSRLPLAKETTENPDKIKDAVVEEIHRDNTAEEMMALLERHFELDAYTRQELWGDVHEFLIRWKLYIKSLSSTTTQD